MQEPTRAGGGRDGVVGSAAIRFSGFTFFPRQRPSNAYDDRPSCNKQAVAIKKSVDGREAREKERTVLATTDSLRSYKWDAPDVERDRADATAGDQNSPTDAEVRVGAIGLGGMGTHNLKRLLKLPGVCVTALCDVDTAHLTRASAVVAPDADPRPSARTFSDFRELARWDGVDALIVCTPDHWHALQGIEALMCGKDVYIEKPLTLTVREGRVLCDVAVTSGRICQTGTQQRSSSEFRRACELVRNGLIGKLRGVDVTIPPNNRSAPGQWEPMPVPDTLDYDMWLGPAPWRPYHEKRCHYSFRFVSDYSGGQMTNWGTHVLDIAQWGLGTDDTGPVRVAGQGTFPASGLFDTAEEVDLTWEYANGVRLRCSTGRPLVTFNGTRGRVTVGRGHLACDPPELSDATLGEDAVRLYRSDDHLGNFLQCVRTRRQPICPPEGGHRSSTVCHLGNIAMRLGRPLIWDPVNERFEGDDEANGMLSRPMRAPWRLPDTRGESLRRDT